MDSLCFGARPKNAQLPVRLCVTVAGRRPFLDICSLREPFFFVAQVHGPCAVSLETRRYIGRDMPGLQGAYVGDAGGIHPGADNRFCVREARVQVTQALRQKIQ